MILNIQNKKPIISFGLGLTLLSCEVGDPVTIYQQEVYNDEYILDQDETGDLLIDYKHEDGPTITFGEAQAYFDGFVNGKPKYNVDIMGEEYMIWFNVNNIVDAPPFANPSFFFNQWVLTDRYVTIPTTIFVRSNNESTDFLPPSGVSWNMTSTLLINVNIENIERLVNTGRFTFPAVETKEIQVKVKSKSGLILTSNKINLIVT
jgi:hypothetical protein